MHEAVGGRGLKLFALAQAAFIGAALFSKARRNQSIVSTIYMLFASWSLSTLAMQLAAYVLA